jgi:hypothetical protein
VADEVALDTVPASNLAREFGRMVANSAKVVDVADRTYEIKRDPETGRLVRPNGMPDETWNIHCDAMRATRNLPAYLANHFARVELAQKLAGLKGAELPKIAQLVVQVNMGERPKYETVDVTPVKE